VDNRHSIKVQFEILVRKLLRIFAKIPSTFAPVHARLVNEVIAFVPQVLGLEEDRLITPELIEAMMDN